MLDQKTYRDLLSHQPIDLIPGELGAEALQYVEDLVLWLDQDQSVICTSRPLPLPEDLAEGVSGQLSLISDWIALSNSNDWSHVLVESRAADRAGQVLSSISDSTSNSDSTSDSNLHHIGTYSGSCLRSLGSPTQSIGSARVGAQLKLEVYELYSRTSQGKRHLKPGAPRWVVIARQEIEDVDVLRSEIETLNAQIRELQLSNSKLAKATQAKDEFLASMSHELRTPLNSIMGLCEALLEGVYGALDSDQHQPIRQVFSNGHHLLSVISDILDLSKLRAGGISLSLNDVDVEACCFEAIQVFRIEMQKKQLTMNISVEGIYLLNADERWFKQVLMNLISNAVKFTPPRRKIGIVVGQSPEVGYLRVTVWDEGIGMREDDIPLLFQTFVQLDTSLARAYEGTGLGLSIVSSVMQLHNGKISVESEPNVGSKFHLDFPWVEERGHMMDEDLTPTPEEVKSILLVEDSEIDADRVRRFLGELDAEVFWDQRGADAISLAYHHLPDVIILDLFLPELSGWEILSRLKSMTSVASIPIIVCSVLERDTQRPEMRFVDAYLQKPFSRQALRRAIRTALSRVQPERDSDLVEAQLKKALMISAQEETKRRDQALYRGDSLIINASNSLTPSHEELSGATSSVAPSVMGEAIASPSNVEASVSATVPQSLQILIVDDNLSNIQLVQDYLTRKGYLILTAEDGYQAVQIARAHRPNLILMDIQMPHMDGIEATSHIKSDPRIKDIPIFALTALAMPGDRERCLQAGMSDYFTKPVSLRGLYKKIKETLGA